jgi:hypothetical protein
VLEALQREALLTWRCCLAYDLRSDSSAGAGAFLWIFPTIENWRQRGAPLRSAIFVALEALAHACSTQRTPPDVARRSGGASASGPTLASERAVVTARLRALVAPLVEHAVGRLGTSKGGSDGGRADDCGDVAAAAHFVASVHELYARGNAHSVIRTKGALDATAARALGRALLRSGALRRAVAALCDALRGAQSSAAQPLAIAAAANLALGALRLARWTNVCSDVARAEDSGILTLLDTLRPALAGDLARFVVARPGAGAGGVAGAQAGAGALPRRVAGRLLSYVQCEAIALFNALARRRDAGGTAAERDAAAATSPVLSLADISAPLFAAGEEADAREWLSSVLTVSCILCTVTFHANHAHNLTRSPEHL